MTAFLPIVDRELRVTARRRGTFWLRSIVVLVVLLGAVFIFMAGHNEPPREIGQVLFYVLTGAAQFYCLIAGLRFTADSLSEEKRDGTLGLLFLTDLKGYDVVLGKLVANSLNAFYGMLAVVPVMGIPLLLGGVAPAEFGRLAVVLVNTLFFSVSAGMLASSLCKKPISAVALALVIVLLLTIGSPSVGALIAWKYNWSNYEAVFLVPSPVFSYAAALDVVYSRFGSDGYFWSLGIVHGCAWACLVLACWIVPRSWQDRAVSSTKTGWQKWRSWLEGETAAQLQFRARTLDRNAYYWLATRPRLRPLAVWLLLGLCASGWIWGGFKFERDWYNPAVYVVTAIALNSILKGWVASESARQLMEDRKLGAMELILSTPLSVRTILRGQRLALYRQFLAPVIVVLGLEVTMLIAGMNTLSLRENEVWVWVWIAGMAMLLFDLVALYWVSMWLALASRNPKNALGGAILRIMVLPWILLIVTGVVISMLPRELQRVFNWDAWPLLLWFGFGILADLLFGLLAYRELITEFRELASQRYQPRPSLWKRMFGK